MKKRFFILTVGAILLASPSVTFGVSMSPSPVSPTGATSTQTVNPVTTPGNAGSINKVDQNRVNDVKRDAGLRHNTDQNRSTDVKRGTDMKPGTGVQTTPGTGQFGK